MDEWLDAAFLANPVPMGGLLGHEVMSFRLCPALPAGHPLAAAPHVSLAALKAERWVLLSGLSVGLSAFVIRACRAAGYYPAIAEQAGEVATLIALVSAREGVTLVPIGPESVETDGVRYVPLAEDLLLPISLTWARSARLRTAG
jgi:DNA-binding transcriptional LysR family regulator